LFPSVSFRWPKLAISIFALERGLGLGLVGDRLSVDEKLEVGERRVGDIGILRAVAVRRHRKRHLRGYVLIRVVAEVVIDENLVRADTEDLFGHHDPRFAARNEAAGGDRCRGIVGQRGCGSEKGHSGADGQGAKNSSRNHGRKYRRV
jgi:hypothetical protein